MQKGQKRNKFIANDFGERKHEQNYLETRNHAGSGAAGTDFLRNGQKTECNDCSLDRHYQQRTADDLRGSIRPSRFSHGLIKDSGEFVINLTTLPLGRSRRLLRRKVRTGHGQVSGDAFDGCSLRKSKSTAGCGKSGLN